MDLKYESSHDRNKKRRSYIKENKKTIDIIAYVLKDEIQKNNLSEVLNF